MARWHEGDVEANGTQLHYERTGQGDKPAIVLAHGITDNGRYWTPLAERLEPDYDVIMYDARGHGLSATPESGYAPDDHAADLIGLIRALDLGRPHVLGHSMGGSTAAPVAATAPELVSSAILEDPPWRMPAPPPPLEERRAYVEEWRSNVIANKARSREERLAHIRAARPRWPEHDTLLWTESAGQVRPVVIDYAYAPQPDWQVLVRQITCPLLLITGDSELDGIVTPEVAQQVVQLAPRARVAHISGAGHSIRREQFERYVDAVTTFLREHSKAI